MKQPATNPIDSPPVHERATRSRTRRVVTLIVVLIAVWGLAAYILAPLVWRRVYSKHPNLDSAPRVTKTSFGHPGDPLNVSFVGTRGDIASAMNAANWHPADALGIHSDMRIALDVVLRLPYLDAPVSDLYLFGRKEDLAYEHPAAKSPAKRHHVRLWNTEKQDEGGRPMWIGAVSFDERVGISDTTGQITHHISPDIDAERDGLMQDIKTAGHLVKLDWIDDFHKQHNGFNGGGDPYRTDGRLAVGVLTTTVP